MEVETKEVELNFQARSLGALGRFTKGGQCRTEVMQILSRDMQDLASVEMFGYRPSCSAAYPRL